MTISDLQRQRTEERIRAAADRLLRGQIPAGGSCGIKTLAQEAGVSRASLYRTYHHLKQEFEQRLARLRDAGHQPDPHAAQIIRLTDENTQLRQRLTERDQDLAHLTTFKTTAISRLAAQHTEFTQLREALSGATNLRTIRQPKPATSLTAARRNPAAPALHPIDSFTDVTVHAGVLTATAALIELLHGFLTGAGPVLHTDLGPVSGPQHQTDDHGPDQHKRAHERRTSAATGLAGRQPPSHRRRDVCTLLLTLRR